MCYILATIPLLFCSAIECTPWDDDFYPHFIGIFTIQTSIDGSSKSSCIFRGLPVFLMRTTRWSSSWRTCHLQFGLGGCYFCWCRIVIDEVRWRQCLINYSSWRSFRNPVRSPLLRSIVRWRALVDRSFFFTEILSFSHRGSAFLDIVLSIFVYSSVSERIISDDTCISKYLSISTFT